MKKLEQYIQKGPGRLRLGYTTGTCAAGAASAAASTLLDGAAVACVVVPTPAGVDVALDIEATETLPGGGVRCAVQKDAGDDPDVTNGVLVWAEVRRGDTGITIAGGEGVGVVTKPGLSRSVGAPAINPGPLRMIEESVRAVCARCGYTGGLHVTISIPAGRQLAARTFNPRLGIEGGLSVLGTTGLVEPMSEDALRETIRLDIRSKRAAGREVLLLTPGNYGRDFARDRLGLDLEAAVKCSNYIGDALDMACGEGFTALALVGHAGKLVKLAGGAWNTHSRCGDGRMAVLCEHAEREGLSAVQREELRGCVSVDAADALLVRWGAAAVWDRVGAALARRLDERLRGRCRAEFAVFGGRGVLTSSPGFEELAARLREEDTQ